MLHPGHEQGGEHALLVAEVVIKAAHADTTAGTDRIDGDRIHPALGGAGQRRRQYTLPGAGAGPRWTCFDHTRTLF